MHLSMIFAFDSNRIDEIVVKNVGFADDIIYMIDYFPWYYNGTTGESKIKDISTVNIKI